MKVKLLAGDAFFPKRTHQNDAGYDLFSVEDRWIKPLHTIKVHTEIAVQIPENHVGIIKDRSSLAVQGVHVLGGVIDCGYTGEILVVMTYFNQNCGEWFKIDRGRAIAQLVVTPIYTKDLEVVIDFPKSERGEKGFGSSDEKLHDAKMLMMDGIGKLHDLNKRSAMMCEHANENPANCNCPLDCYCKTHTCLGKSQYKEMFPREILEKMLKNNFIGRSEYNTMLHAKEKINGD